MLDDLILRITSVASAETIGILALIAAISGLIRGLTGFGAGMIFVPLAGGLVGPVAAIGLLWGMDGPSVIPMGVRSARRAQFREIAILFAAFLVATPVGLWLLQWFDPRTTRWIICLTILFAAIVLMAGWRFQGHPTPKLALITGLCSGLFGGLSGLPGPPVVMLWLAAAAATAHNLRDNINMFFVGAFAVYLVMLPWYGLVDLNTILVGLLLAVPYTLSIGLGTLAFHRLSDRNFRRIAHIVIAGAALLAMPALDAWLGRGGR